MKKNLLLAAATLLCASSLAFAQPQQQEKTPEEIIKNKAESMASKLLLSDSDAAKFVPVYSEYLKSIKAVQDKYRPAKPQNPGEPKPKKTDKEIEAGLRAQLAKSQEILDLRKTYLDKYLKIMSARQVRELYKIEQDQQRKHLRSQAPKRGPQAPVGPAQHPAQH